MLKALGFTRSGNFAVGIEPKVFVQGCEFAHRFADGVLQTGLLDEGRIGFQKAIVRCPAVFIE
ncbi:hypothetical protein GCM10027347_51370 [Larkinella harenae]